MGKRDRGKKVRDRGGRRMREGDGEEGAERGENTRNGKREVGGGREQERDGNNERQ